MKEEETPDVGVVVDSRGYLWTGNLLIDRRARRLLDRLVEQEFRAAVDTWAAEDTGRLPTRLAIRFELAREFETLCAALGPWALVEADEIFPAADPLTDERER